MREKVWFILCNTKFKSYYLGLLVNKFQKWDRSINIFLALTSSGSIATWAIWSEYPFVWAGIIAITQVLSVIKPYFPYFKYVKEMNTKVFQLEVLNIEIERVWYKLEKNKISEEEIEDKYFEYRKQIGEILNFQDDTVFGLDKKCVKKANEKMYVFLKSNYGVIINTN